MADGLRAISHDVSGGVSGLLPVRRLTSSKGIAKRVLYGAMLTTV